jgi:signal transduction histidine kinase
MTSTSGPGGTSGPSGEIVMVDADRAGREYAADLLRRAGFRCRAAASGVAALNLCKSEPAVNVLLLTMPLPDLPMQDLPARLGHLPPNIAVVVLCDPIPAESAIALMRAGVSDLLFCPVQPERLLRSVDEASRRGGHATAGIASTAQPTRQLLQQLLRAQEDERRRIARDLHDGISQSLVSIILALEAIHEAPTLHFARQQASEAHRLTTLALDEVRRLARGLRPSVLDDLGLEAALEQLAMQTRTHRGLRVDLHAPTLRNARLPIEVETVVYRIVQEAVTNVIKHAQASCLSVIVERRDGQLRAVIEDDGRGFDLALLNLSDPNAPLGLIGMRERAESVGGSLTIESGSTGTSIYVHIPLPDDHAAG